jgi:hypothetical protein
VPIPRDLRPGARTLVLKGNGFDADQDDLLFALFEALSGFGQSPEKQKEPKTVRQLAASVAAIHRPLGIAATFKRHEERVVLKSDDVRYDGQAKLRLRVVRARH